MAVSNDPGGCVCYGTVVGIGGVEMSIDWMMRSWKGEQK